MAHNHHNRSNNPSPERDWFGKCLGCTCFELFWPRVVHKWLNISSKSSDYSADSDDSIYDPVGTETLSYRQNESRFKDEKGEEFQNDCNGAFPRLQRRKSETFRAQFIDSKEIRVSANTWNVGGKFPPEDLDIRDWLDTDYPADIYVIGFQEIIPLNAGNMFGSEDNRPIPIWENIIRETLDKVQPVKTKYKCYSDPPSPSRFKPSDDSGNIEHEVVQASDSYNEVECTFSDSVTIDSEDKVEESVNPFKDSQVLKNYRPLESYLSGDYRVKPDITWLEKVDLDSIVYQKRKSQYVRIVSKQMVGVFITIWVRRSLRKHIQNVHVSTVGVGLMGYIGNKGSISVSMSIYQTHFCFVCSHLKSGEREIDIARRNDNVHEIYKRTCFNSMKNLAFPRSIKDHERIIWFGDLNYRFDLAYEETCDLISKNAWSKLLESDQLRKGRAFEGWTEGTLNFPPTYKYEPNSDVYYGKDPKAGRRTPAWCDRVLSYGKGMKQLSYRRTELRLSDHRPVSALYMIEVEVLSLKKLQRALLLTDAEIEDYGVMA